MNLATGAVTTVAGNGVQRLLDAENQSAPASTDLGTDPLGTSLSSPWDVLWSTALGQAVVAMAGTHQIFAFDPATGALSILAGTGLEGLLDGDGDAAWFAQSSGLAQDAEGSIWVADSETSALRRLRFDTSAAGKPAVTVDTAVGAGLFDFGYRDGDASEARLQHPLGVAVLPDGSVAIADTYNGAVRRYDPATQTVSTLSRGLAEPSGVLVDSTAGEPLLVVVEANKHQLVRLPIPKEAQSVDEGARQTQRPKTGY